MGFNENNINFIKGVFVMKNNQVKETKQKKSFKEVVYDNQGKIIAIGESLIED